VTPVDPRTVDWGGPESRGIAKMRRLVDQLASLSRGAVGWYGPRTFAVWDRSAQTARYAFGIDLAKERDRTQYLVFRPEPKRPFLWLPRIWWQSYKPKKVKS